MSGGTSFPPDAILRLTEQLADLQSAMLAALPTTEPVASNVAWLDSGIVKLSAGIPPTITDQPDSVSVAEGSTATFSVTATNATGYQWQLDSGAGYANISGATSSSYTTPTLVANDHGNLYRCVVTGPGGSATSTAATLSVELQGDVYVSTTGNDSNDGLTRATAWLTISRLNTWAGGLTTGSYTAVIAAGTYSNSDGFGFTNNNTVALTLEFEEGVTIDTSAATTKQDGISIGSNPLSSLTVNLRGAIFTGNTFNSANGIGTNNEVNLTVNGAASDGTLASFSGYDDGISFHGISGPVNQIQINDCRFYNCPKGAYVHVNSAAGAHNRCIFDAKASATLGIGSDQSSVFSEFYDCEFNPAANGDVGMPQGVTVRCKIGTTSTWVYCGTDIPDGPYTDCFMNIGGDGPGSSVMTRCYGYVDFRIRGPVSDAASWTHCVFEGKTNTTNFANGAFDGGSGNWLGGSPVFRDCVLYDYGTGFSYASTTQRDHMNANWTVDYCCMFENATNFAAGLTIGTNIVTTDPALAGRTTREQSDWVVGDAGSCVGAGSAGGNIGFTLADIS